MAILMMNPLRGTPEAWTEALGKALPGEEVRFFPNIGNPADIDVFIVGIPTKIAELPKLPNIKLNISLLAGVDGLVASPHLPDAPLVKVEPPTGDTTMMEYCMMLVLYHHRDMPKYRQLQMRREWTPLPRKRAEDRTVGFLGFGTLGKPMAEKIKGLGFNVIAWARTPRPDAGIEIFVGEKGFGPFLAKTEIAVNMLALTEETRGILNAKAFAQMPKGAAVINLARGGHVVEKDLIAALDSGQLGSATLDVTEPEPLPSDSPLWTHPGVTILPHVARRPSLAETMPQIIENMHRLRSGKPFILQVDKSVGY